MRTRPNTKWELDSEFGKFKPRQNKTKSFENMVTSHFQRFRPPFKVETFNKTDKQKKTDAYSVDGFCGHCNTVLEAMVCFYHYS